MLVTTRSVYTVDLTDGKHICTLTCDGLLARIKIDAGTDTTCPFCFCDEPTWPWDLCLRCGVPIVTALGQLGADVQYGAKALTLINEFTYRP
jgi:hypothetical protein